MNLQRIETIKKYIKIQENNSNRHTYTVRWRDENLHLVVIKVETSFLRYNLENGRTRRNQSEYLNKNPMLPHYLFDDPESNEAQNAQHEVLLDMVDEKGLKSDILEEGQRQPAIITVDGYVINGNRRLAVLKEDGTQQYMDCVVLPEDANPWNLYDLEVDLQMAIDTKADYDWVNELLHIRHGIVDLNKDEKTLAKLMKTTPQKIRLKLAMLDHIDLYLDWLGKPGNYYSIEDAEQAFIEIAKYSKKINTPDKQKMFRNYVFTIIKERPEEGRLYDHIKKLFSNLDEVASNIEKSIGIVEPVDNEKIVEKIESIDNEKIVEKIESVDNEDVSLVDDPLEMLANTNIRTEYEEVSPSVLNLFDSSASATENAQILVETIQDADAKAREKKDRKAALKGVSEAQRKLQIITIDSSTMELDAIYQKLNEIIRKSGELIKIIDNCRR